MALGLVWQEGDANILERAQAWSDQVERVYVLDLRVRGESFGSLAASGLHYAPFRQKTSLGTALNRALCLAYEEAMPWLWILDGATEIRIEELLVWSQKTSLKPGLYRAADVPGTQMLFRTSPCGLLVSVAVARSLGGWNPVLPAQRVFTDFEQRLLAQGGTVEKGLKVHDIGSRVGLVGLWARLQDRFFPAGIKSR